MPTTKKKIEFIDIIWRSQYVNNVIKFGYVRA